MTTSLQQAPTTTRNSEPRRHVSAPRAPGMPVVFSSQLEMRELLLNLTRTSERQLAIWSVDFDRGLFESTAVIAAIKRFVLSRRHARVRLLTPQLPTVRNGRHALLELAECLPASFEVRTIIDAPMDAGELLLTDDHGVLYRIHVDGWDGMSNPNDLLVTRFYMAQFDACWRIATPIERVTSL